MSDQAMMSEPSAPESRRIASAFLLHRRWISRAAGAALLIAAVTFLYWPRQFDAVASVAASRSASDEAATRLPASPENAPSAFATRILLSPDLIEQTVQALSLSSQEDFSASPDMPRDPAGRRYAAIAKVQESLRVQDGARPGILIVHLAAADRLLAVRILDDLLGRWVTTVHDHAATARKRLEAEAAAARVQLTEREAAEAAAEGEAAAKAAADTEAVALGAQRAAAVAILANADAAVSAAGAAGSSKNPDSPTLQILSARQRLAAEQLSRLSEQLGPLHPKMIAAERDLADARQQRSSEVRRTAALLSAAESARKRMAELGPADVTPGAAEPKGPADEPPAADLTQLKLATSAARERYRVSADRLQRPPLPGPVDLRIVKSAQARAWPSTPNPIVFALGGLLAIVLAAAAALWLCERLQPGFRTPRDVEDGLNLPVVALVPDVAPRARAGDCETRAIDLLDGDPAFARACERMAAKLGSGTRQCVAVCSAVPNEGKTTISICFARYAARAGMRVVLVDCDGRRRELSRLVASPARGGLVQFMRGTVPLDVALVTEPSSGVCILPHSSDTHVETELFASAKHAEALIGKLLERFDLVVLDTAPVLALEETRVLASVADKVLLVARWRKTPVGATRVARDMLVKAKASISGVALTRVRFA